MNATPGHLRSFERGLKGMGLTLLRMLFRPRSSDPLQPDAVRRILVIRQHNQLGDMLCATPLLRALRARYPGAYIALLTSPVNHSVMLGHPALDETILFDKREFLANGRFHPVRLWKYLHGLRRRAFDLVLVPATVSMSATSDILAYLTGARWRIGVASLEGKENPSGFLYTHGVHLAWAGRGPIHQTVRNMEVARHLGLGDPGKELNLALSSDEREHASARWFRSRRRPVVAFHVGAGKVPNRWPADRFADVIDRVSGGMGMDVVMISGPMDAEPVENVRKLLHVQVELIQNESIRAVASCLFGVVLLVTNDTGIMHVGAAAGVPVLSIFGPTDPEQWAPVGPRHRYIKSSTDDIAEISVDDVLRAIVAMAGSTGASGGRIKE